eukprot:391281-Hanusia_phi.AAC.2
MDDWRRRRKTKRLHLPLDDRWYPCWVSSRGDIAVEWKRGSFSHPRTRGEEPGASKQDTAARSEER